MKKAMHVLAQIIEMLTVICFVILGVLTFINLGSAWVGVNTVWTDELISCFTTWMVFLGYSYLCEFDQHVSVTILHDYIPAGLKNVFDVIIRLVNIVCGIALTYSGYMWLTKNITKVTAVLQIEYKYWYCSIAVCSAVFTLFALAKLVEQIMLLAQGGKKA